MASDALEEKINKIRLQNEEIRRRHEEVEADKKNAAKLNALVQLVPSDDWPERKEPPEFSAPPKNVQKQKNVGKEHNDRPSQHYPGIQERIGKKDHKFAQGEGPPPDPKYNFLADSEREMRGAEDAKSDEDKNKSRNKTPRGGTRKRGGNGGGGAGGGGGGSREAFFKDNRGPNAFHSKEESLPEYEAWRAERNKIDEARIKRQKTAEGNWRREWDSNKTSVDKEPFKKGDSNRKEYERRNNYYNNDYSNRGHGGSGSRTYHGSQKNHGQQDHRRPHHEQTHEFKRDNKSINSPTDDRSIAAVDKNVKVTINQTKGPVMSVKVNSPSIAGTGRVGPRQKSRVTYSSQSDAEMSTHEVNNFSRQKSFDEKTAAASFNNGQKAAPKSPFAQRKKDGNAKSPFPQRKEYKNDESGRPNKNPKTPRNEGRDQRQSNNNTSKPQRAQRRTQKPTTDKNETVSVSDNAIPSEYDPEKPLNPVESVGTKDNIETNSENISDENNVADLTLQDTLKNSDDSVSITEQNAEDNIENSVADNNETTENNEIAVNHETNLSPETENSSVTDICPEANVNIEHIENIEKNMEKEINQGNNQTEEEEIKCEISITNEQIKCENKDNNEKSIEKIECENKEETSNEKLVVPELQSSDIAKEDNESPLNFQRNTSEIVQEATKEVNEVTASDNVDEKEIISDQKNNELVATNTSESQQTSVVSKIESEITSVTDVADNSIELEKLNNKIQDDNIVEDKINKSIEIDETKTVEKINNSQNMSVNDSGFVDDSDNLNNASTIEINQENNEKNSQVSDKSDFEGVTKEICEKTEICDIRAASSEIAEAVEVHVEKNEDKQESSKTLEDSTKDCEVNIQTDVNERSETSKIIDVQKVTDNDKPIEENVVEEKSTTITTEESKKD